MQVIITVISCIILNETPTFLANIITDWSLLESTLQEFIHKIDLVLNFFQYWRELIDELTVIIIVDENMSIFKPLYHSCI